MTCEQQQQKKQHTEQIDDNMMMVFAGLFIQQEVDSVKLFTKKILKILR